MDQVIKWCVEHFNIYQRIMHTIKEFVMSNMFLLHHVIKELKQILAEDRVCLVLFKK